jgi:hypothetical protein
MCTGERAEKEQKVDQADIEVRGSKQKAKEK